MLRFMESPEGLMRRALHEARKATRKVRPNPRVGCVIEIPESGELIEAYHEQCGEAHAEVRALEKLRDSKRHLNAKGARVAVTLEPCSHHGKTPPCVDALIAAGVKEVYIPFLDPNPLVGGRGIRKLIAAGIQVELGICATESYHLNREWLWAKVLGRPFVSLKIATDRNGVGVPVDRKWITSPQARQHAMLLRSRVDVLITSGETLRQDNPAMTVRSEQGERSSDQARVLVFSRSRNLGGATRILEHPSWEWHESRDLRATLEELAREGVFDVMVECGPALSSEFLLADLVDEIWHYEVDDVLEGRSFEIERFKENFDRAVSLSIDERNILKRFLRKGRSERDFLSGQSDRL